MMLTVEVNTDAAVKAATMLGAPLGSSWTLATISDESGEPVLSVGDASYPIAAHPYDQVRVPYRADGEQDWQTPHAHEIDWVAGDDDECGACREHLRIASAWLAACNRQAAP